MDAVLFVALLSASGRLMRARPQKRSATEAFELNQIDIQINGSGRRHDSHISRRTIKTIDGVSKTYYRYY